MLPSKRFLDFDSKKSLIEFIIVLTVGSILLTVAMEVVDMFVKSNSIAPTKQYCIEAGGQWSEGIQYGRITQLCTYN